MSRGKKEVIKLLREVRSHWLTLMEAGDYEASEGGKIDLAIERLEADKKRRVRQIYMEARSRTQRLERRKQWLKKIHVHL